MPKPLGRSFLIDLQAAGLNGLPFSWTADGTLIFDPSMTPAQCAAVQAVADASNDATGPDPFAAARAAIAQTAGPVQVALTEILKLLGGNPQ